jgi:hypothetical protein
VWGPQEYEAAFHDYPGFVPGVLLSLLVSYAVSASLGRQLGVRRVIAWSLVFSIGIIVSATLTPGAVPPGAGSFTCDLSRLGPASLSDILTVSNVSLNVFLFIPLGLTIAVTIATLRRTRSRAAMLLGAIALPFAIETIQLIVPPLDRACQSSDVADNLTGLSIGLLAAVLAGGVAHLRSRDRSDGR